MEKEQQILQVVQVVHLQEKGRALDKMVLLVLVVLLFKLLAYMKKVQGEAAVGTAGADQLHMLVLVAVVLVTYILLLKMDLCNLVFMKVQDML
jgi:hypothetical protein